MKYRVPTLLKGIRKEIFIRKEFLSHLSWGSQDTCPALLKGIRSLFLKKNNKQHHHQLCVPRTDEWAKIQNWVSTVFTEMCCSHEYRKQTCRVSPFRSCWAFLRTCSKNAHVTFRPGRSACSGSTNRTGTVGRPTLLGWLVGLNV